MAVREIDENELLQKERVVTVYNRMLQNPKSRELLEKAFKTIEPNASAPITDAKAEVMAEVEKEREARLALEARMDKERDEREADKARNQFASEWDKQKSRLRSQGYTDEGIASVEKLCEERGIADLEAGAALHDRLHPPADPVTPNGFGHWNLFEPASRDGEDFKKLLDSKGEDDMALRKMVDGALTDMRGGVRR